MEIKGNRFLVIGGAGFIGSHIIDQLLESGAAHVRVYDNFSRGTRENLNNALKNPRMEIFPHGGDILQKDILSSAMQDIDGVFHLAALWLLQCNQYPRSAFDVNVTGTMNVIEAAITSGIRRLIFSSSASVYGDAETEPMPETHPLNCQEFYGASKVCGEMIIRALSNRAQLNGQYIGFVGLRYMNVYGPRQYRIGPHLSVVANMINALEEGKNLTVYGDGSQAYDFIDVRDCARANICAMQSNAHGEFYNVGTGKKITISELGNFLLKIANSTAQLEYQKTNRAYVRNRIGSTSNAENEIGFKSKISLEEGLMDLFSNPQTILQSH